MTRNDLCAWESMCAAKVIEIKDGKSIALAQSTQGKSVDGSGKEIREDQIVDGVVIKFNKHGALSFLLRKALQGLAHVSEFGTEDKLRETFGLGKTYKFKISLSEPKDQRMTLSYKDANL